MDYDVGPRGPVCNKWYQSCFPQKVSPAKYEAAKDEMTMLVKALDEFNRGRMLEVGDIIATRLRALAFNAEGRTVESVGRQLLCYNTQEYSLVSNAVVDTALRLDEQQRKREKKFNDARRARSGTPVR